MSSAAVSRGPRVVVNADDFGRSAAINAAVMQAHHEGILTSASLMVTGEAFAEAVELARRTPTLAVGLHVVLVHGRSVLPHREIPHLVDASARFFPNPTRAGLRYYCGKAAREELTRELTAQFERFAATGLPLSHVDGHLHMHLHPAVLPRLLPLAVRHGACGLRVPRDRYWLALRHDRRSPLTRTAWAAAFALLSRAGRRRLRGYRFAVVSRAYGLMQSGRMDEAYVVRVLRALREPTAEMYFHPTTGPRMEEFGPNPDDLRALTSPAVRQVIEERRIQLTTYPALCGDAMTALGSAAVSAASGAGETPALRSGDITTREGTG